MCFSGSNSFNDNDNDDVTLLCGKKMGKEKRKEKKIISFYVIRKIQNKF